MNFTGNIVASYCLCELIFVLLYFSCTILFLTQFLWYTRDAVSLMNYLSTVGQVRGSSVQQHQQRIIVQQLQLGVSMGNIHPQILNLPLNDRILRSIQQLLNLQQNYQHHYDTLMRVSVAYMLVALKVLFCWCAVLVVG